ncbi:MAG TPA: metal-dependent hydrolase [Roseiflexaceae bacterium]|nr:metal-dependent hydrolase [Roseiflexaceae bacterium]
MLAGVLAAVAVIVWRFIGAPWALLPGALAWGIVLHDVADLVTPHGIPLFYPISDRDFHILPESLRHFGEPIIAGVALVAGVLLSGVVHF